MTPKMTGDYLEAQRNHILDAACACFTEKGFHKATMRDVYEAAKLSPGAVYNYFRSKDDIITAIVARSQKENVDMISAATATDSAKPLVGVLQLVLSILKAREAQNSARLNLEIYAEASRNPLLADAISKSADGIIALLAEQAEKAQSDGEFNMQLRPEAIARVMFAIYLGLMIQKTLDSDVDIDACGAVWEAMVGGSFSQGSVVRE